MHSKFAKLVTAGEEEPFDFWIAKENKKGKWQILYTNDPETGRLVRWDEPPYSDILIANSLEMLCARAGLAFENFISFEDLIIELI